MDLNTVEAELAELNETFHMLIEGFKIRDAAFENHTKILVHQTHMLNEIKDILTEKPEEESPLLTAVRDLVAVTESNTAVLLRLEKAVAKLETK